MSCDVHVVAHLNMLGAMPVGFAPFYRLSHRIVLPAPHSNVCIFVTYQQQIDEFTALLTTREVDEEGTRRRETVVYMYEVWCSS